MTWPRENGHPTVILQARISEPFTEVFDVTIPIEKRRGSYRYRATIDLPTIAAGRAAITHVDVDIGSVEGSTDVGGNAAAIAAGEGSVWVVRDNREVVRIDPGDGVRLTPGAPPP